MRRGKYVEKLAELIANRVGQDRLIDKYHEAEFAMPNLDTHLQHLYHDESDLIVVFLCAEYAEKEWCGLEWRAIRDLIKKRETESIMMLRFDNTPIQGVFSTDGYVLIGNRSPHDISDLILRVMQTRTNILPSIKSSNSDRGLPTRWPGKQACE